MGNFLAVRYADEINNITYRVGLFQFVLDKQFQLFRIKFIFSAVVIFLNTGKMGRRENTSNCD